MVSTSGAKKTEHSEVHGPTTGGKAGRVELGAICIEVDNGEMARRSTTPVIDGLLTSDTGASAVALVAVAQSQMATPAGNLLGQGFGSPNVNLGAFAHLVFAEEAQAAHHQLLDIKRDATRRLAGELNTDLRRAASVFEAIATELPKLSNRRRRAAGIPTTRGLLGL